MLPLGRLEQGHHFGQPLRDQSPDFLPVEQLLGVDAADADSINTNIPARRFTDVLDQIGERRYRINSVNSLCVSWSDPVLAGKAGGAVAQGAARLFVTTICIIRPSSG